LLCYPHVLYLHCLRMLLVVVLAIWGGRTNICVFLTLLVLGMLFTLRNSYGQDGSDQMSWIIVSGLAIVAIAQTPTAKLAFIWFVTFQVCLAYCVAGFAKASAKGWRDGTYLLGILATRIYGYRSIADRLKDFRTL